MGFDPVTAAIVAGTATQIYGLYAGGKAAEKEAKYQTKIARNNMKLAKKQAEDITAGGLIDAATLEQDAIRLADNQLLAYSGAGIDITSGVAVQAVEDTARIAAADIIQLQHNIAKDVWAKKVGLSSYAAETDLLSIRARNAQRIANINIASLLINTGIRSSQKSLPGGY